MNKFKEIEIGRVANFVNGFAFKPTDWEQSGTKIIRIQNLTNPNAEYNLTQRDVPEKYIINDGDILVSWSATIDVFEWNKGKALLNQHIFKVDFNKKLINKDFFVFALRHTIKDLTKKAHGSTMKHVTKGDFDSHLIPLPPLSDQIKIATLLKKTEDLIQKRKESIALLDELVKSTFLELFGNPVINNKDLEVLKLEHLGSVDRGVSKHRPRNAPELLGGVYPLIQTGDVAKSKTYIVTHSSTYSELGLNQSKIWKPGTVCITIAANIGKTGILSYEACFPDSIVGFIPNSSGKVSSEYIHVLFSFYQPYLEKNAPESAQKNINLKVLRDLDIPVPEPVNLLKFNSLIESTEELRSSMNDSLNYLEELYNSLSQRAFNGELDLSKINQETFTAEKFQEAYSMKA